MNIDELLYFVAMEEMEEEMQQQGKVNVENSSLLVSREATQEEE